MAGEVGRPPVPPPVLLSVWSMSVRCRSEVWERWRRSPYCHSSLLWQGGADQGACGLAVGEDPGRRQRSAGSSGPRRSMGLLRPDLGPVLVVVATVLRRLPLRLLVRSLVRDVAPRADHTAAAPASTRPARPGRGQTPEDARPARSGSARTSRISVDTAHWFVAGIVGAPPGES